MSVVGAVGKTEALGGSFNEFICEGKKVEVESNSILEGGHIETRDYGKIRVEFANSVSKASLSIWMTQKQKNKMLDALKAKK